MNYYLCQDKFDTDVNALDALRQWTYWLRTFNAFLKRIEADKLINFFYPHAYELSVALLRCCGPYTFVPQILYSLVTLPCRNKKSERMLISPHKTSKHTQRITTFTE